MKKKREWLMNEGVFISPDIHTGSSIIAKVSKPEVFLRQYEGKTYARAPFKAELRLTDCNRQIVWDFSDLPTEYTEDPFDDPDGEDPIAKIEIVISTLVKFRDAMYEAQERQKHASAEARRINEEAKASKNEVPLDPPRVVD